MPSSRTCSAPFSGRIRATQVRSYPACELEGTLPKAPLAEWLKSVVGSDAKLTWQVSTELKWTGDPPPPETPLYVRVTWWSYSKQFGGQILLNVAVLRADGASRLEPPTLDYILAGPTGGSSRGRDEVVPTLSELALRIARRPSRPTAKAK